MSTRQDERGGDGVGSIVIEQRTPYDGTELRVGVTDSGNVWICAIVNEYESGTVTIDTDETVQLIDILTRALGRAVELRQAASASAASAAATDG